MCLRVLAEVDVPAVEVDAVVGVVVIMMVVLVVVVVVVVMVVVVGGWALTDC